MQEANGIIQATGLTVGNTYLLMIDGYNGDDCDFRIYRVFNSLPVEWTNFHANLIESKTVQIDWGTSTEINNRGYYVQRGRQNRKLSGDAMTWESLAFVEPKGAPGQGASYQYIDHPDYIGESWYYRIQQIDLDGTADYTNYQEIVIPGASESDLHALFPNPASTVMNVKYYAEGAGKTFFAMYNLAGALVKQENFSNDRQGNFTEQIDVQGLPNGLYGYVLSVNGKFFKGKLEILH